MSESLAEALPREIERVQELLPLYDAIPTGIFAATMMRESIKTAQDAMVAGDVVQMIRSYEDLQGYKA
ncbi:hypothetical protein ABZR86_02320 [Dyella marensis]|uniref:Uncharacterized protein n=1 Tax=Dyella marensis TaxID=500610 RepID=A0A1I2A3J4_9GAMM|nr:MULTISPECIES: hypothetical protein [Dyella]SFE38349.1 hypothetical protein SAMN02799615_00907 [Dyella marensis]